MLIGGPGPPSWRRPYDNLIRPNRQKAGRTKAPLAYPCRAKRVRRNFLKRSKSVLHKKAQYWLGENLSRSLGEGAYSSPMRTPLQVSDNISEVTLCLWGRTYSAISLFIPF